MADVKISGLPASTVPLAGTEVLPLVQGETTKQVSVANLTTLLSSTFASLPTASTVTGQIYRVTDIGANGSLWRSNGTIWIPANNTVSLLTGQIPFAIAPTGILAVTTGVVTFGTAMPSYYIGNGGKAFLYYPAGTWTGSTAGWYWTVFTNSTTATVYSNTYTTGQPVAPTSLNLVTTGAGAYVGVTGNVLGPNITTPANCIAPNNLIKTFLGVSNNNSAGAKVTGFSSSSLTYPQPFITSTTGQSISSTNILAISADLAYVLWYSGGYALSGNIRITQAVTQGFYLSTAVATDWTCLSIYDLVLESQ